MREARAAGMSQAKAAEILGLSVRALERWPQEPAGRARRGTPRPWNTLPPAERAIIPAGVARRGLADCSCRGLSVWVLEQ